jgi:hypothetical protein
MTDRRIESQGAELRHAILSSYQALSDQGKLSPQIGGSDITAIVAPYLPAGTPFPDAEEIVKSAGFALRPRPGSDQQANPNRARDWDVVLAVMELPPVSPIARSAAYVSLQPAAPLDYRSLIGVTAAIRTSLR